MEIFEYVAVLTSIIIGLGIAHVFQGVARLIQHPKTEPVYWVHVCWVGYVFLSLVFWWWWEFGLGKVDAWTFQLYIFVVFYAVVMFMTASILFPDSLEGYDGYQDYYYSRRTWIFGLIGLARITDIADSLVKGVDYFMALGLEYHIASLLVPTLCIIAAITRNARFHAAFSIAMLSYLASWALRQYWTVG